MRQRVMIAMGTICRPGYLLCDEPTTALDVTTQKGIIELIRCMKDEHDMGIVFITHDLKLLKNFADKVIVMCRGRVVESGTVEEIFTSPRDEYTRGLIAAIPDRTKSKSVFARSEKKQVLFDISFDVRDGEIFGIVGESGCGKSTLSRTILGMNPLYDGSIVHNNKKPQMIFQDPYSSLNPAWTIGRILREPLLLSGIRERKKLDKRVSDMLHKVGLDESYAYRHPSQLSGGQRQRISIAAALIACPKLVIADEPLSALDVTIQSQIMQLLIELKREMGLTYIFISHDIDVVYQLCDRIMVMKDGRVVEIGDTREIFDNPREAYTRQLIEA